MTELMLHLPLTPFAFDAFCLPPSYNGIPAPIETFGTCDGKTGKNSARMDDQ